MPYLNENNENRTFVNTLTRCVNGTVKSFKKNEFIMNYGLKKQLIGLVLEGTADLIKIDIEGNAVILETLTPSQIFSEIFMCYIPDSLSIVCTNDAKILFLDYNMIIKDCRVHCPNHNLMIKELFQLLLNKAKLLNEKIVVLACKTIQNRIITYLELQKINQNKKTIELPFSYSDFAHYLCINRSALMREIKNMQVLGIMKRCNRKITLYKNY